MSWFDFWKKKTQDERTHTYSALGDEAQFTSTWQTQVVGRLSMLSSTSAEGIVDWHYQIPLALQERICEYCRTPNRGAGRCVACGAPLKSY